MSPVRDSVKSMTPLEPGISTIVILGSGGATEGLEEGTKYQSDHVFLTLLLPLPLSKVIP